MDEKQWIARAQVGDRDAFSELVGMYQKRLLALVTVYLGRQDAPDAAQDIWIAVYGKLWQLEQSDHFWAWLKKVVFYHCLNRRKQRAASARREVTIRTEEWLRLVDFVVDERAHLAPIVERRELRQQVSHWLDCIPGDYGLVLRLRYIEGLSYEEVAELAQLPLSTIKWRLHQGKKLLRAHVMKYVSKERDYHWRIN